MKLFSYFLSILFILASIISYGQNCDDDYLSQAFIEMDKEEKNGNDIAIFFAQKNFEATLKITLKNSDINSCKRFRKVTDSLTSEYAIRKMGKYEIFTLQNQRKYWNYILKDKVIINEWKGTSDYFVGIHQLDDEAYLLIKRNDDMSFTCYQALIYMENIYYQSPTKAGNNLSGIPILNVCSWTSVDLTNPTTSSAHQENGLTHLKPISIDYHPKNKTISYTFFNINSGENITRQAKYKNGTFVIKSYDARTFEE